MRERRREEREGNHKCETWALDIRKHLLIDESNRS
jgi:hypothetical protein